MTRWLKDERMLTHLTLREAHGLARRNQPLRCGVPFACGALSPDTPVTLLEADGARLLTQSEALSFWPDGSVKWLLLDAQVSLPAHAQVPLTLIALAEGEDNDPPVPMEVMAGDAGTGIMAGGHRFLIGPVGQPLFVGLTQGVAGLYLRDMEGEHPNLAQVDQVTVETNGPVRTTVRVDGRFSGSAMNFVCRLDFFRHQADVGVQLTVHNPQAAQHPNGQWDLGDAGSIRFKELSFRVASGQPGSGVLWNEAVGGAVFDGDEVVITQGGSGGANWDSASHVDADGTVSIPFPGYQVKLPFAEPRSGDRTQPTVCVDLGGEPGAALALSCEQFWQNFPKSVTAREGGITLSLFPEGVHELQGGEKKTHRFWCTEGAAADAQARAQALAQPLIALPDPQCVAESGAIPWFTPEAAERDPRYTDLIAPAVYGDNGFIARREIPDEYGWRDFGDLFADHEGAYYPDDVPLISHYNNQYDGAFGLLIQALRSGDPAWLEPATDLVRHVVDIDIYHTRHDKAAYNGGLFWHTDHYRHAATCSHRTYSKQNLDGAPADSYGGGPANEHLYTSGLLLYHHLTGDLAARDAVLGLADWVVAMDDGRQTVLGWVDSGPTGLSSQTCEADYHGPGRGAGNAVVALLDGHAIDPERGYLAQAEALIARTVHPHDPIAEMGLNAPERRWSYTIYLQAIGKYLRLKEGAGTLDRMYDYARQSLLAYGRWMAEYEVPYLSQPEKLEYPTETWAAQELRKGLILDQIALYTEGEERQALLARARFFYAASFDGLATFDSRALARPLCILLSCGWQREGFNAAANTPHNAVEKTWDHGHPAGFKGQKQRVKALIKNPLKWPVLAVGLLKNGPKRLLGG